MTHLTTEQLLTLREPGLEPGLEVARRHLGECPACRDESRRLDQRVARLRALATPRPGRDHFPAIRGAYVRHRRRTIASRAGIVTLALAASALLVVRVRPHDTAAAVSGSATAPTELEAMVARSQQLEETLRLYDPDSRVIDARTAAIAARLEDRLSALDREIELTGALGETLPERHTQQLRLWRERVNLLDALMDVHLTRASYAGM